MLIGYALCCRCCLGFFSYHLLLSVPRLLLPLAVLAAKANDHEAVVENVIRTARTHHNLKNSTVLGAKARAGVVAVGESAVGGSRV